MGRQLWRGEQRGPNGPGQGSVRDRRPSRAVSRPRRAFRHRVRRRAM